MVDRRAIDVFRERLLGSTVRSAASDTAFYKSHYDGIDLKRIRRLPDLARLPTVDKPMLRDAGLAAVANAKVFSHVQHTSGTTGMPFVVHRSMEEAQFIERFFGGLIARVSREKRPLQMSLQTPFHGTSTLVPSRAVVLNSVNPGATADLLRKRFSIPGADSKVSIITGPLYEVCKLTQHARAAGLGAADFHISAVHTTGDYQSRRLRRTLARAWKAAIVDHFSMSEAFGGAMRCAACESFHFDPNVVPEIIDVGSGDAVREGVGMLLLTCLHPFVQMQPLIRYRTGDLFRVATRVCPTQSYEYLGRVEHALFDPADATRLLLSSVDLYEALDSQPGIARFEEQPLEPPVARGFIAPPRADGVTRLSLEIGVARPLLANRDAQRRAEQRLREELASRSGALANAFARESITLAVDFVDARRLRPLLADRGHVFVTWEMRATVTPTASRSRTRRRSGSRALATR